MGGYAAPAGAASTAVGTAANAYGQDEAAHAMAHAWAGQARQQQQFTGQERAAQQQLLGGLQAGGVPFNPAAVASADAQSANVAKAMTGAAGAVGARRRGGASAAAPATGPNLAAMLGRGQQASHLQNLLNAITQQQQGVDILGRTYHGQLGAIRDDAHRAMIPMQMRERAAGMAGGDARTVGTLFNLGGQAAMNYGMAQPAAAPGNAPIPEDQAAAAPMGGWAGSREYHNSDGSTSMQS